jgi:hypothetical protein
MPSKSPLLSAVDRRVWHAAHHHALGSVEDLGVALLEDFAAARVRARLEHGDPESGR